jgi:hypothetical protein
VPVLAVIASTASAQATTLTFNTLTPTDSSGVRYVSNCYVESGVRISVVGLACGTEAALATWTPQNPLYYTGSPALYNNLGAAVDFMPVAGGPLSLTSIDLAPLLGGFGNPTTVMFTGTMVGGGTMSQTFNVPGMTTSLTTFSFASGWTNLSEFRMTVTGPSFEPYVQFDNVRLSLSPVSTVPEPTTVALVATGLLALGAVAHRRARAARADA